MPTFADVQSQRLRSDPGRPLVTFYDEASGERIELSVTTWANWVAKAAALLVDELDLERGMRIRIDLPPHWLGTVFLGAAWSAGLVVTDSDEDLAAVVCGPDRVGHWSTRAGELAVLASALAPLGVRFTEALPAGVHDLGVEIWSQPDAFVPWDPPTDDDVALDLGGVETTQGQLWTEAAAAPIPAGSRLLSVANPATEPSTFCEPLATGGSLVLVASAERDRLQAIYVAERATARFPA